MPLIPVPILVPDVDFVFQKQQQELVKEMEALQLMAGGDGLPPKVEICPPSPTSNL
jgi:hypothetical protein